MKVDRNRHRPVRHLEWRVRLLGVGAVIGLAGIYFDASWMVNVAIGILVVSFALRFTPDRGEGDHPFDGEDEEEESGNPA
jgi:hypothetical protein